MNVPDATMSVALLSDKPTRNEHLRAALDALGATVAYESVADTFDRDALERSGARVVIVNLDDGDNSEFDAVYDLLDDDRYRVLINDGGVSSALSGWDQARWMRHLGAKIFGNAEIHPPRPANAQAIPDAAPVDVPEVAADAGIARDAEAAPAAADALDVAADEFTIDMPPAQAARGLEMPAPAAQDFDFDIPPLPAAPVVEAQVPSSADPAGDFDFELPPVEIAPAFEAPDEAGSDLPVGDTVIELAGSEDADAFADSDWTLADDDLLAAPPPPAPSAFDDAAQTQAVAEPVELPLGDFDLDLDLDAPTPPVQLEAPGDVLHSSGDSGEWSIDALLDDVLAPPPVHADDEVVVDKVSAAEYLAPETEGVAPPPVPSDAFMLELVPLEDVVAPVAIEKASHENWLDPDSAANAKIRRVWVLGASIGGPEAVRIFLSQLPAGYPALFLLAQHLGDEFVETMTRQLSRSIALTVRTPAHGDRASHGEVFVVPNDKRLLVEANGVVVLQDLTEQPAYRPSIDRVLEDVAERFGAGAGAIVFSGMSDDAADGSKAIAARGGKVYVQSPESCVVSTMIDGVLETGVVQFQGAPEELARKLNEERG